MAVLVHIQRRCVSVAGRGQYRDLFPHYETFCTVLFHIISTIYPLIFFKKIIQNSGGQPVLSIILLPVKNGSCSFSAIFRESTLRRLTIHSASQHHRFSTSIFHTD